METAKKSTAKYWVYFFISIAALIFMIIYEPRFFWIVLPFSCTYFAKGLNLL